MEIKSSSRRMKFKDIGTMLSSAFITLFSLKGDGMHFNLTPMVMVSWLFLALVITGSYTASLTSLLSVPPTNPATIDVQTLLQNGDRVGYDARSFVGQYLQTVLNLQLNKVIPFYSEDKYVDALITGKIAAAFLEAPYVRVFLAKYCKNFFTSGPTFEVGGFGFVFAKGFPYVPDISEAVISVAESGKLKQLEDSLVSSYKCSVSKSDDDSQTLEFDSFKGLFVISWVVPAIALLIFFISPYVHQYYANWLCKAKVKPQPDLEEQQQRQQQQHDEDILFFAEMENQRRLQ